MMPRILLVDDEQSVLDYGVAILSEAGYPTAQAINGDVALLLLRQDLPIELLIADVVLPGRLDGFALAYRAQALIPDIRVIYSTGFASVARIRSRGAIYGEILVKPWRADDLLRAVAAAIRRPEDAEARTRSAATRS